MNEILANLPILKIALGFDMKPMHFHIAKTCFTFENNLFSHLGATINNCASMKNCPGMQGRLNKLPD